MHVGYTAIFQNPNQSISDYDLYQKDMAIAKLAAAKSPQDAPPKPFYMRPADAAPSRDTPPRILA